MKKLAILFLVLLATFSLAQNRMSYNEIINFKKSVKTEMNKINTFSATFTETKHLSFLKKPTVSKGKFYLQNPNKVLWQYTSPSKTSVIFVDNKITLKQANKSKITDLSRQKNFAQLNALIIGSFNGDLFDNPAFESDFYTNTKGFLVRLMPKSKTAKKYLKRIELQFDKQVDMVSEVKLIEPSNDYTQILFSNKSINPNISPSIFRP
ncbi:outer membrane lipoprotein carrier protein LolA [Weeksella virosa]|uniref:LolA family protein n=1 Tax=Weeksella virosa TaxID=1014 RepID=UPI0025523081|nr:outer membrane lipoprotein carrier protein LolA [Weeksella virosa]MDK7374630.1 outer membrane lipoprotein carrier protein LolA [Weeksella virosa]